MEKRKWLWKRKSSERSPGESDSSGSFSSYSERYSDEQDALRESPNNGTQSPEVTSKSTIIDDGVKESMKSLTEKLSAALVNVSAKEDLVKQHAKVAEEAVAGWEKAENEVAALKQQLEVAVQQNLNLEVRVSHLEGALKECVRQLRQARDEQEQIISDAMVEKNGEWESTKAELEKQILELQVQVKAARVENSASIDPNSLLILEAMEKENSSLKQELVSRCKDLEIMKIERDLSTQAAETASKQQLESIKKIAKLEAECRRLQAAARKSSPLNDHKSVAASSFYAESVTDSHSDGGERLNILDIDDIRNKTSNMEKNGYEPSCSDSWASLLISELDNFKNEKPSSKSLATCTVEIDMMDDFLEMERLAALPDAKVSTPSAASDAAAGESISSNNPLKAEVETLIQQVAEMENKLGKMEGEKLELERALDDSQFSLNESKGKLADSQIRLEELQKELTAINDAKELLEFQLIGMEAEARTMSSYVDSLKTENERERMLSSELKLKCQELENELAKTIKETELQHSTTSNGELKLKKEDLAVAADKLAECQKTIASLGRQLQSLATLEDFLIDTSNIPGISTKSLLSGNGELWRLHSNDMSASKCDLNPSRTTMENSNHLENGKNEESPLTSSSSTSSANHITSVKSRNGFGKFFSLSKSVIEIDNRQD